MYRLVYVRNMTSVEAAGYDPEWYPKLFADDCNLSIVLRITQFSMQQDLIILTDWARGCIDVQNLQ